MKVRYILLVAVGMYLPTFAMAQVSVETLRPCLDIEDQTKERLDCYDDKLKPTPKKVSAPAKTARDCRYVKQPNKNSKNLQPARRRRVRRSNSLHRPARRYVAYCRKASSRYFEMLNWLHLPLPAPAEQT
jgi:hypothetical protein